MGTASQRILAGNHPALDTASEKLVEARRTATALDGFPGDLPTSLEQAYALQSLSITRFPGRVAGWKVGMVPPDYRAQFDDIRLAGPIFGDVVVRYDNAPVDMPVFAGGFAAVEAEIIVELNTDIAPGSVDFGKQDIRDLIASVSVGTEIASSPMAAINALGPMAIISDFGNNRGLIVGKDIAGWRDVDGGDIPVSVAIDGVIAGRGTAADIPGGYLEAVRFLIAVMARRDMALPKGTLVSTGAITGVHDASPNSRAHVSFGPFGKMDLTLSAFQP